MLLATELGTRCAARDEEDFEAAVTQAKRVAALTNAPTIGADHDDQVINPD